MLDQIPTLEIETLSGEVLGLDHFFVGVGAALCRRRIRQLAPTGLVGDDRARKPTARHDDTTGVPIRHASRGLTGGLSFGRGPDRAELRSRHPNVVRGDPGQVGHGHIHEVRMPAGTDREQLTTWQAEQNTNVSVGSGGGWGSRARVDDLGIKR